MEELSAKIKENYGLIVYDSQEVGSRHDLATDSGTFYLFNCPATYRNKAKFIQQVGTHLANVQAIHLLPSSTTYQNEGYFFHDDKMYYVKQGVRSSSLENEAYVMGETLARFHQATATFNGDKQFRSYSSFGNWPTLWKQKLDQFDAFRDRLDETTKGITPFDEYLLTTYTYVKQLGDTSVQYLNDTGYQRRIKEASRYGKIAFQNFDEGFLLFTETGEPLVAGEWNWIIDMRSRDIAQWIKSDVKRNGWNEEKTLAFLTGYSDVSPLANEEFAWMYALLLYPGRFLKLIESYQQVTAEEQEELEDWEEKLDGELLAMETALQQFPLLVCNRYGAVIPALEWSWWKSS